MSNPGDYTAKAVAYKKLLKKNGMPADHVKIRAQGENCIYIGGGLFSGLEMLQMTEGEMRESLRAEYNNDTDSEMTAMAAVTLIQFDSLMRLRKVTQ